MAMVPELLARGGAFTMRILKGIFFLVSSVWSLRDQMELYTVEEMLHEWDDYHLRVDRRLLLSLARKICAQARCCRLEKEYKSRLRTYLLLEVPLMDDQTRRVVRALLIDRKYRAYILT